TAIRSRSRRASRPTAPSPISPWRATSSTSSSSAASTSWRRCSTPPRAPHPPPPPHPAPPGPPAAPPRRGGPSNVMRDPGFPALADYVRRIGYVMSMGRPAASVALYIPSSSMWLNDRDSDTAFVASEQMLSERQVDFDIINQDALATDLKVGHGTLETMSGNQYRTVIIPSASILSQTELDRLKALASGGGKVLLDRK